MEWKVTARAGMTLDVAHIFMAPALSVRILCSLPPSHEDTQCRVTQKQKPFNTDRQNAIITHTFQ